MADRGTKIALFDEFARVGRALASGRRIELLDVLANGERTVEALAGEVGLSVANTSHHLQTLRLAGLVTSRRAGTSIHYRLAGPEVFELWRTLRTLAVGRLAEVERLAAAYLGGRDQLEPVTREESASWRGGWPSCPAAGRSSPTAAAPTVPSPTRRWPYCARRGSRRGGWRMGY